MGKIAVADALIENDIIWMLDAGTNYLFRLDGKSNELEYIANLDNGLGNAMEYGTIVKYEKFLILFPIFTDNVAVYDIRKKKCNYVSLPKSFLNLPVCNERCDKVAFAYLNRNRIYAFGADYPGILVYNLDMGKIDCLSMANELNHILNDTSKGYFPDSYTIREGFMYIPVRTTNYICKFNLESMDYEFVSTGKNTAYEGCCLAGGKMWLVHCQEAKVTIFEGNMIDSEEICIEGIPDSEFQEPDIHCIGENVYIHTNRYCIGIGISDKNVRFRKLEDYEQNSCLEKIFQQRIYRFTVGEMTVWDKGDGIGKTERTNLYLNEKESAEIFADIVKETKGVGAAYTESYFLGLEEYIDVLWKTGIIKKQEQYNVGEAIYEMVRKNWSQ